MYSIDSPVPLVNLPIWVQSLPATVQAGFPSPAEDHAVTRLDLMAQLIKHPQATFMLRVRGDSMKDAGILDGSVVLVDKAIQPRNGHVVVACIDNEYLCKYFVERAGHVRLKAANNTYPDITPKDGQTLEIWGVVVASILQHKC
jgi:DNA polymerase V